MPKDFNPKISGKTPFTPLKLPSRDNSPINAQFCSFSSCRTSSSTKSPIAIGKSKFEPSFFKSAGARFITTFLQET